MTKPDGTNGDKVEQQAQLQGPQSWNELVRALKAHENKIQAAEVFLRIEDLGEKLFVQDSGENGRQGGRDAMVAYARLVESVEECFAESEVDGVLEIIENHLRMTPEVSVDSFAFYDSPLNRAMPPLRLVIREVQRGVAKVTQQR